MSTVQFIPPGPGQRAGDCDHPRYQATPLKITPINNHVRACGTRLPALMQRHAPSTRKIGPSQVNMSCALGIGSVSMSEWSPGGQCPAMNQSHCGEEEVTGFTVPERRRRPKVMPDSLRAGVLCGSGTGAAGALSTRSRTEAPRHAPIRFPP